MDTQKAKKVSAFQIKVDSEKDKKTEHKDQRSRSGSLTPKKSPRGQSEKTLPDKKGRKDKKLNESSERKETRKRRRKSRSKSREKSEEKDNGSNDDNGNTQSEKTNKARMKRSRKGEGYDKSKSINADQKKRDVDLNLKESKLNESNDLPFEEMGNKQRSTKSRNNQTDGKSKKGKIGDKEEELNENLPSPVDVDMEEMSSPRSLNDKTDGDVQEDVEMRSLDDTLPEEKGPVALETANGIVVIIPHPTELTIKGKAKIQCLSGTVCIMGYHLHPDNTSFEVYSPECNSLVTMATTSAETDVNIAMKSVKMFICDKRICNTVRGTLHAQQASVVLRVEKLDSGACDIVTSFPPFTKLFSLQDGSPINKFNKKLNRVGMSLLTQRDLSCLEIPKEMHDVLVNWTSAIQEKWQDPPVVLVCGGKDSGKSTTSRIMLNTTLNSLDTVYYLECDIGQTEFTPPGCVSLHKVSVPVFGPPFCHQREPVCSYQVGGLSPKDDPDYYIDCVRRCFQCYQQQDKPAPLVVNTMGWMKGLGLQLLVDTVRLVFPSHIVQLTSSQRYQNVPSLTEEFHLETSWTDLSWSKPIEQNQGKLERKPKIVMLDCIFPSTRVQSRLQAADHRNLSVLSHLGNDLEPGLTLTSMLPRCIRWQDVAVHVCNIHVPRSQVMYSLNASLVALCEADITKTEKYTDDGPMFFPKLPPYFKWVSYGIVRGIDPDKKVMYITTSLSVDQLASVNTIVKGAVTIPDQLLLSQKSGGLVYVDDTIHSVGAGSVKPRRHMPRRGLR